GDSGAIGSVEYRYHLARTLDPREQEIQLPVIGPFRAWPRTLYNRPDWDLILKAFADGSETWYARTNDPAAVDVNEHRESLFGVGLGVELQFMRYFRGGVDLAWPRSKLSDNSNGGSSPEVHGLVTLMF